MSMIERLAVEGFKTETRGNDNPEVTEVCTYKQRSRKLYTNMLTYSGEAWEDVDKWILIVRNNFKLARITDDDKVAALCNYVKGSAF